MPLKSIRRKTRTYSDGSQKSVILQSVSKQNLLDLAPMVFKELKEPLNLKLEQTQVSCKSAVINVIGQPQLFQIRPVIMLHLPF